MRKHINFECFYFLKAIIKFKITLDLSFCIDLKYIFNENIFSKNQYIKIIDIYSIIRITLKKLYSSKFIDMKGKMQMAFQKIYIYIFKVLWLQSIILMSSKYNIWGNGADFDAWFYNLIASIFNIFVAIVETKNIEPKLKI